MRAMLDDVLACFQRQFETEGRCARRMARETEEWFFSDAHWTFSFGHICVVLGLEPESIRQELKRWSQAYATTPQRYMQRVIVGR
jgi:hypothetical protein